MIRTMLLGVALGLASPAMAQDHDHHNHHADHDHEAHAHQSGSTSVDKQPSGGDIALSRTPEIEAALSAGGEPVVVEVLGVVCDFCAKAMNKTFGKRDDVAAVYVDLDAKTLNLVLRSSDPMSDQEIDRLVTRAGYKTKAIHRGDQLVRRADATDPA